MRDEEKLRMDLNGTFLLGKDFVWEGESQREEARRSAFLLILRDSECEWRQHRSSQPIRTRWSPRWGQADVHSFPPVFPHQLSPCQQLSHIQLLCRICHLLARRESVSIIVIFNICWHVLNNINMEKTYRCRKQKKTMLFKVVGSLAVLYWNPKIPFVFCLT